MRSLREDPELDLRRRAQVRNVLLRTTAVIETIITTPCALIIAPKKTLAIGKHALNARAVFAAEDDVWYGTNEYNFEKLPDPPSYEPTKMLPMRDCRNLFPIDAAS